MMDRRRLLSRVTIALSGGIAALVGVPIVGYLLAPLVRPLPVDYVDVGSADAFHTGETTLVKFRDPSPLPWAGQLAETALWVRRRGETGDDAFQVFSVHCTHLGCPVNWRAEAGIFLCPCHGGVFYADGTVAGGPPERPLFERAWKIDGGRLLVKAQPLPTVQTKGS
ncbi:MAG TPA: ubiquinol-cytochrome c reductase iron-sulfur subunit [Candidatus Limnocylindria bacterium]|nr:ubiquinol-cytochrome c reductase iron-sulfur subunit [Candidatus Limnocylindria bacterium]